MRQRREESRLSSGEEGWEAVLSVSPGSCCCPAPQFHQLALNLKPKHTPLPGHHVGHHHRHQQQQLLLLQRHPVRRQELQPLPVLLAARLQVLT